MSYFTQDNTFVDAEDVSLHPSATRTASGTGSVVYETGPRRTLSLLFAVTAASGDTPTLDVTVQTSHDGTTFRTLGTFTQATGVTSERKGFGGADRFVRVVWTAAAAAGSPSFTFAVTGEAV